MQAPSGGDILLFHSGVLLFNWAAKDGRDGDAESSQTWLRHEQEGIRGSLFDEDLLDGAIIEDEDVQALLERGLAMAGGGEDLGGRKVRKV